MNLVHLGRGATVATLGTFGMAALAGAIAGGTAFALVLTSLPSAVLLCTFLAVLAGYPGARAWVVIPAAILAAFLNGPMTGALLTLLTRGGLDVEAGNMLDIALFGTAMLSPGLLLAGIVVGWFMWTISANERMGVRRDVVAG